MPKGSNQATKRLVRAGVLCYVCEKSTPTYVDEVDGHVCHSCFIHMQVMLLEHQLTSGYHIKTRKRIQDVL